MKIRDIINLSMPDIQELSDADLRQAYTNLKRSSTQRRHGFERAGLPVNIPEMYRYEARAGDLTRRQLEQAVSTGAGFINAPIYTAGGFRKYKERRKNELKSRFGLDDMTDADFDRYGQFMNAMQDRLAGSWKYVSAQAKKLAAEAQRLNLDPMQFMRNFEYWQDHVDELENARPIERGNVRPSDYVRQLGLPGIRQWNREERGAVREQFGIGRRKK